MYCKNCGKKLSESARFCDRCGQPSGTAPKKPQRTSSAQGKKQAVSRRQPDSYDRYRKKQLQKEAERKRRRKRTRIITIWVILIALAGAVGGGIYAYYYTMKNSGGDWTGANASASPAGTQQSSPSPSASSEADRPEETSAASSQDNSGCEIYIDSAYGFRCPYPAKFETGTLSNRNTRLSLKDPEGDGEMLISYEKISETQTAANLMRDYVKGIGVSADFNRAGENWYEVDFKRNGKVNHRKAVIIDNSKYVYFDFTYNENTEHKKVYDSYIDYADEYLENQYTEKSKEIGAEKSKESETEKAKD